MGNKKKRNKSKKPPERPGYKSIRLSPELAKGIREDQPINGLGSTTWREL